MSEAPRPLALVVGPSRAAATRWARLALRALGYEFGLAGGAGSPAPNVVIVTHAPGDAAGAEAASSALRDAFGEHAPRLALTDADSAGLERLLEAGAHDFLAWPRERSTFAARLRALAGRAEGRRYRLLFESAFDAVATFDAATGQILDVNRSWLELYGYERPEALALRVTDVRAEPARTLAAVRGASAGRGGRIAVRWHRKKNGQVFPVEICSGPYDWGGRRVLCTVLRDVTERVRAEADVRQRKAELERRVRERTAELERVNAALERDMRERKHIEGQLLFADRMASVGRLASGVAHEINNPLASVLNNVAFALDALDALRRPGAPGGADLGRAAGALEEAAAGASRALAVVRDLKTFARADHGEAEALEVAEVFAVATRMARHEFGPRVVLLCQLGPLPPVIGDAARLGQLFVNLLVNAAQASAEAGGGEVRVGARAEPGGHVVIEVDDEGAGIAPELVGRVFDPFFTTKPVGRGAGLGLSVCHGIVTAMGGEIAVERREPKGTRVRVVLPAAFRPDAEPRHPAAAPAPPTRRGRVLVIDDDAHVGRSMARLLGGEHDVVALTDPREALAALLDGAPYDAVFCDLMMPHVTGIDVDDALRRAGLTVPLLFMTAGVFTEAARSFLESCERRCLEKPVDPAALRRLVNEIVRVGPAATLRPPRSPRAASSG